MKKSSLIAFISVATLVGLFIVDAGFQNWEITRLVDKIEESEEVMNTVIDKNRATKETYYSDSYWWNFDSAELEYVEAAREAAPKLSAIRSEISDILILPWHLSFKNAQEDYLSHNGAWISELNFESKIGDERLWSQTKVQEINNTWAVFCTSAVNAVPNFDIFNTQSRIAKLCND